MKCDVCNKPTEELYDLDDIDSAFPLEVCTNCKDKYFKARKKDAVKQFKQFIGEGGD